MADQKSTYIVLVNWNQYEYTASCIRSLLEVTCPGIHIVVVDNGSTDQSARQLAADFGAKIELVCNAVNLGFTGGNNAGIRYALEQKAGYVMLLNNDTVVAPDFLSPLVARLDADPLIGAVTSKIYYVHDPTQLWAAGGTLTLWLGHGQNRGIGERDRGQYDRPEEVDFVTGCCILARREIFERVGLLNEKYFIYFEDAEWCLRVREAGYKNWYEPASHIWHWAGSANKRKTRDLRTGRTNPHVYYLVTRNNLWFLRAHAPRAMLPMAVIAMFVRHMLLYSVAFLVSGRLAKLRALWAGWRDGWARNQESISGSPRQW